MNFKFCGAASYKFNQKARHTIAPKQHIWRFAEIFSRRRAWQTAEISPRQYMRRTARILQNRSLPRTAKILLLRYIRGAEIASAQTIKALLLRHMPQGEISRAENRKNFIAIQQAASRRNFIEIARMMRHQITADSHKIPNESCRTISAERGAAR